jgi:hypothetical protein
MCIGTVSRNKWYLTDGTGEIQHSPLGQGEDWHADGVPITFGVSLAVEGVGTEVLAPQPVFDRHEDYKYLDAGFSSCWGSWASAPCLPTSTRSILVFAPARPGTTH